MTIASRVNWCVCIVEHDEVARLGTVQAQTYREAYQKAARQFGLLPERQSRLFVRPIDRRVRIVAKRRDRPYRSGRSRLDQGQDPDAPAATRLIEG